MERAERVILLCIGLLFDSLLVPILWLMLVLTAFTAVQRFVKVWHQAVAAPVVLERQAARRSRRVGPSDRPGPSPHRVPPPPSPPVAPCDRRPVAGFKAGVPDRAPPCPRR